MMTPLRSADLEPTGLQCRVTTSRKTCNWLEVPHAKRHPCASVERMLRSSASCVRRCPSKCAISIKRATHPQTPADRTPR